MANSPLPSLKAGSENRQPLFYETMTVDRDQCKWHFHDALRLMKSSRRA
jgi:hypothetical protein